MLHVTTRPMEGMGALSAPHPVSLATQPSCFPPPALKPCFPFHCECLLQLTSHQPRDLGANSFPSVPSSPSPPAASVLPPPCWPPCSIVSPGPCPVPHCMAPTSFPVHQPAPAHQASRTVSSAVILWPNPRDFAHRVPWPAALPLTPIQVLGHCLLQDSSQPPLALWTIVDPEAIS